MTRRTSPGRTIVQHVEFDSGSAEEKTKNPPCQSARRVSENLLGNSKSSLAVFYVEQVALNRHVFWCDCKTAALAATPANPFMPQRIADVKNVFSEDLACGLHRCRFRKRT